jgi:hypothetical protein
MDDGERIYVICLAIQRSDFRQKKIRVSAMGFSGGGWECLASSCSACMGSCSLAWVLNGWGRADDVGACGDGSFNGGSGTVKQRVGEAVTFACIWEGS